MILCIGVWIGSMVPFVHVNSVFDCIAFVRFHFFVWLCCYSGVLLEVVGLCVLWSNLSVSLPIDRFIYGNSHFILILICGFMLFGFHLCSGKLWHVWSCFGLSFWKLVMVSEITALCTRFFSNPFKKNETCMHLFIT